MNLAAHSKPTSEAEHLRRLAEWHRAYADTSGSTQERDSRLRFAAYLDRLAVEKDTKAALAKLLSGPLPTNH